MILKKIKSLTLLLIIVVAFFDNSAKAQTFPLTNLIVHGWQKIDVLPYGVADTTIYKSVIWNKNNGKLYKIGTMGGGGSVDSLFVTYCCGCNMIDGWKALEDTIKIDTCYVNQIIKDSLSNHYDLIHGLDTGKVSTSGDIMYGDLIINSDLEVNGAVNISTIPLGTDIDSVLVMENGQLKSVDGSSFKPDSTSSGCFNNFYYKQITGCDNNNIYIKADTTKFSNYIKLPKFANNNSKPVLSVTSTGNVDTISVKDIDENYVRKSGDILNGVFDLQSGDILLTKYAAATGDKVAIIKESGILDTIQSIPIESAIINNITLIDSIIIGGITHYNYGGNLLDDADFTFPLNSYGFGNVYVFNAGMKVEYCRFILNVDGSFELQDNSGNVEFSNVDGNVCLYSNAIQNRLGATRYFMIELKKN